MAKYKIKVDQSLCIGSGSCVDVAPDAFMLDKEGKSVVKKKDGTTTSDFVSFEDINDSEQNIMNSAKVCPVNAIVIIEVDDDGNEIRQVWPS